jgi:hypothetical protein
MEDAYADEIPPRSRDYVLALPAGRGGMTHRCVSSKWPPRPRRFPVQIRHPGPVFWRRPAWLERSATGS